MEWIRRTWLPTFLFGLSGFMHPALTVAALVSTPLLWGLLMRRRGVAAGAAVGALNAVAMFVLVFGSLIVSTKLAARQPGYQGDGPDLAIALILLWSSVFWPPIGAALGALAAFLQRLGSKAAS